MTTNDPGTVQNPGHPKKLNTESTHRFEIRNIEGKVVAVHGRRDFPNGTKSLWWERDGTPGLKGLPVEDLPLFGSHRARRWPQPNTVIVTEGEKASLALFAAGFEAVATVTGAYKTPSVEAMACLVGHDVVLWPDNDEPGWRHMARVALRVPAYSVRWIRFGQHPGEDAADAIVRGVDVHRLVAAAGEPDPGVLAAVADDLELPVAETEAEAANVAEHGNGNSHRLSPIERFNAETPVTDILVACGVPVDKARPGKSVICIGHDDRSPSLSILRDNRRVICHSGSCVLSGARGTQGHDAYSLAVVAREKGWLR